MFFKKETPRQDKRWKGSVLYCVSCVQYYMNTKNAIHLTDIVIFYALYFVSKFNKFLNKKIIILTRSSKIF